VVTAIKQDIEKALGQLEFLSSEIELLHKHYASANEAKCRLEVTLLMEQIKTRELETQVKTQLEIIHQLSIAASRQQVFL